MKKQNYISAIFMILIFLISTSYGYWLGKSEYNELLESYLSMIESDGKKLHSDARFNMAALEMLARDETEQLKEFYTLRVRSGLETLEIPGKTFAPEDNQVIYQPKKELVEKARQYQSKYCNDKCLGI